MSSSKRNILHNSLSTLGQKGVRVVEQLFLIPFFLEYWGTDYYGEWLTLTIMPSILGFADMGLGSSASNSFVLKFVAGKYQEAFNILKTGFRVITVVVISSVIIGLFGILLGIHLNIFQQSIIPFREACIALGFMMLAKLLGFYMQLYEANYRAAAKAALGINLQTLGGFLTVGGGLSVLILGYGVIEFAFSQFIFAVINNILYGGIGLSLLPERKRFKGQYSKSVAKDIFSKGFGYLMNPMWQVVLFQGTTLIIRLSLGPASVAMFNTVRTLSRSVNQMYSVINGGIFPEIQILLGQGNYLKAKSIFIKALKITGVLAVVGLIIMSTIGLPIYSYWTKNELNPPYILWFLMVAATAVNAIWWTGEVIFRALNKPYQFSTPGLIASIISVVLSFVLAKSIGIIGVGIGCLVFELIMATYILPVGLKLLKNEN